MIDPHHQYRQAGNSIFMNSVMGMANVLAFAAAFFGAPLAYAKSIDFVQSYTQMHYGYGFEDIIAFVWFAACAAMIFFIARTSVSTALVFGGVTLMTRFV